MQIVVLKAYRNKLSDKRNIGVTQSAPLFYPKAKRISAKSGAILRRQKLARIPVGEQRNFCKQKCDVPLLVCLSNSTLSAQRSAYFFKTLYGTTFPHTARLHKFMNNPTVPLRAGCRGRQPLHLVQTNSPCRKIAPLFADFTLCYGMEKAVQSFVLRHRFDFAFSLFFFYCFSAPLL